MKKAIQIVSTVVVVLSIMFFLYGTIKLSRVEAVEPPQIINPDFGDEIKVELITPLINKEKAEVIIGVSIVTLVLGVVGFSLSSRKKLT